MDNIEKSIQQIDRVIETLTKELESLNSEELHQFFMFYYKLNHTNGTIIYFDQFEEFLSSFDANPFKINEDKKFRKQLIDNVIKYSREHMSLITAAVLIKKKFTIEDLIENYYASVDVFENNWY